MTQDAFTTIVRGFEVTLEAGETDDVYTVHVVEGSGVPWTVEIPVNLDNFEGDNDDLDGSNELLNFVAGAAVDLFESSRNTLGQGAGALEVTAMKRTQCCDVTGCGGSWQSYYLQLKDTPFETQAIELIKQLLALQVEEPEDPTGGLLKEKRQLEHELNLLELELLQNSPEQQTIIIVGGRKQAYFDVDIPLYLDLFAGSPQEQQAMSIIKELLDIQEKIQQAEENSPWNEKWRKQQDVELQLQELVVESIQQNAMPAQTGIESAPNMANDIAELMEGVDLHTPLSAHKRAQEIRTEGMWDYTEEFQMSNPIVAGRPVRLRKPHDESWLEAARHSMCVMEVLDPKMSEQKGRGQGSGWLDLQTIRTDDVDYLPPEYAALFDSEMPPSIFDEDEADPAFKTSRRALASKRAQGALAQSDDEVEIGFKVMRLIMDGLSPEDAVAEVLRSVPSDTGMTPEEIEAAAFRAKDIYEGVKSRNMEGSRRALAGKKAQSVFDDLAEETLFGPDESADPYKDGFQAGEQGSSPADNPYRGDSEKFDLWAKGLNDARSKKRSRRAFEEFETAEDRETEGGEIRHDLDTGCIDPEDYKFEPNQKVTLNKKLELMIGGGVPKNYDKGTPCVVESRYDGQGDMYYVRFEDGQMARVLFSDLTGGGKKKESYRTYMEGLLGS